MVFLRIYRDRRGYEYYQLVSPITTRRGKVDHRVLYWFHTPPHVKVGREPFDHEVRRALEVQYPEIVFDWEALSSTPMPPPSAEYWREKRRVDRAARQMQNEVSAEEISVATDDEAAEGGGPAQQPDVLAVDHAAVASVAADQPHVADAQRPASRRRRRRGARARQGHSPEATASVSGPTSVAADSSRRDAVHDEADHGGEAPDGEDRGV